MNLTAEAAISAHRAALQRHLDAAIPPERITVSMAEFSGLLGISPLALKKRIARGTLDVDVIRTLGGERSGGLVTVASIYTALDCVPPGAREHAASGLHSQATALAHRGLAVAASGNGPDPVPTESMSPLCHHGCTTAETASDLRKHDYEEVSDDVNPVSENV